MDLDSLIGREIRSDIETIEKNKSLYEGVSFVERAEAVDFIEFHVLDRIECILRRGSRVENLAELKRQAESLKSRLEEIDEHLFQRLRVNIRSGSYTREDLRQQLQGYAGYAFDEKNQNDIGYDALDVFVNGLLRIDLEPEETKEREPVEGNMLQDVLERLRNEARKRPIRIGTYGPCTLCVSSQAWLRRVDWNPDGEGKLAVFRSI